MNNPLRMRHAVAPVALFAYKRPDHLRRTLVSLKSNHLAGVTDLFIFCDGARERDDAADVNTVRAIAKQADGMNSVTVVEQASNQGLANSVIAGVSMVVQAHGRVIVLEDDMETSPWFLTYMNDSLDAYADDHGVASIHGYAMPISGMPDYYFLRGADCWGWATWSDRWQLFDPDPVRLIRRLHEAGQVESFNAYGYRPLYLLTKQAFGEIDSWYIRWHAAMFLAGKYTLHPGRSFVRNIGLDGSGTHGDMAQDDTRELIETYRFVKLPSICEATDVVRRFNSWYSRTWLERGRGLAKSLLGYIGFARILLKQ